MNAIFQWNDRLSIDRGQIDQEHKHLLTLANDVIACSQPQRQTEHFKGLVKELYQYMETHFADEEALMAEMGYPRREEHIEAHREIIEQMNRMLTEENTMDQYAADLRFFMCRWVIVHIEQEDAKIGQYLATHPAGQ